MLKSDGFMKVVHMAFRASIFSLRFDGPLRRPQAC
jgi:hypothetical protein